MLFVSNMSNFLSFPLPFVCLEKSVSVVKKRQMPALGIHLLAIRRSTGCPVGGWVGEEIEPQAIDLLQVERAGELASELLKLTKNSR